LKKAAKDGAPGLRHRLAACLAWLAGPFSIDPRTTSDQWVLILFCALFAAWFAAILLFHPS
jgi:hypothetical protein